MRNLQVQWRFDHTRLHMNLWLWSYWIRGHLDISKESVGKQAKVPAHQHDKDSF